MISDLRGKYYVKKSTADTWDDVTTRFAGVKVLKVEGLNAQGEAVNVYDEQWVTGEEDFMVTRQVDGVDMVARKNVDVAVTFVAGERYGATDTVTAHDAFVDFMCNHGDIYLRSMYSMKDAHVIAVNAYKPTLERLHRGDNAFIMGTLELHCVEPPTPVPTT